MKKKIFLTFLVASVLVFLFAITIGAKENYNYEYTLSNKTTLIHYNQFNYTKGESQVISNTVNKDEITITFVDENGQTITKVPMWEYDETTGKYYGLVWYIANQELTYEMVDQYTWAQGTDGKWGNQYDTEGDQRAKYKSAVYTLKKVRAVDLVLETSTDKKTYSYSNKNHENCTWTWSRNGQTFTALKAIYLDEEKTIKLQAPVGIGQSNKNGGYEGYVAQYEATGNKIVVANLKDLNFQTHYTDSSSKSLWTLATNLQCLWYPETVVHVASGVGAYIRDVEFEGLEVIGCQIFRENKYITEFRIPPKCEYVCDEAFRETPIKTIRYGESVKIVANAVLSGSTPTTYYISSSILSDSYLTGFTNTTWGYGYIINSSKATVYFAGTKAEAEAFWGKLSADNSSYTEVHYYDYNKITQREGNTGLAIFYNYNKCDALYKGEHNLVVAEGNTCSGVCDRTSCGKSELLDNPVHNNSWIINNNETVSFTKEFVAECKCVFCGTIESSETIDAILYSKGISYDEKDATGIFEEIRINKEALELYAQISEQKFDYGIFALAAGDEQTSAPIIKDENGNASAIDEKTVYASFANTNYTHLRIKITGLENGSGLFCGAYLIVGERIVYISDTKEGETVTKFTAVIPQT